MSLENTNIRYLGDQNSESHAINSLSFDDKSFQASSENIRTDSSLFDNDIEPLVHRISQNRTASHLGVSFDTDPSKQSTSNISRASALIASIVASVRKLQKSLGVLQGFAIIFGVIIGSGIFISPSLVIVEVQEPGLSLIVWVICGLIALIGSLCYCELGTVVRKAGGNYAYILYIYGPVPAFLCTWNQILLVDPCSVAAVALTLANYILKPFNHMIDDNPWYRKAIAAGCILLIAFINCISIKAATSCQTFFTVCQMISVLFIVVLGFWQMGVGHTSIIQSSFQNVTISLNMLGNYGTAFFGGLWAYNGWQYVGNIVEDMKDVETTLFVTVMTSVPFVILSFVSVNLALLTTLTPTQLGQSNAAAVDFVNGTFGEKIGYIMPILIALSCYGCANGCVFAFSRMSLSSGREGQFPEVLGMIHRKRQTPVPSILLVSILALLILVPDSSNLQFLINFASICVWVNISLAVFGIVVLRYTQPELRRPFRVWLIAPIFTSFIGVTLIALQFFKSPINSAITIGLILSGLPVYFALVYLEPRHPNCLKRTRSSVTKFIKNSLSLVPCSN